MHMVVLFVLIYLQNKFEMSSFSCSKYVTWPKNLEMGHVILTTSIWGTFSQSKANTLHGQLVYKIWCL